MKIIDVTSENFKSEVLNSKVPVLVDFNADWCGPCRMVRPVLDELAEESNDYKIVSVNVDDEEELAAKYNVLSIPCMVLIKAGNEVGRSIGFKPKSELKEFLGGK